MLRKCFSAALFVLLALPILAQPAGRGIIVEINPDGALGLGALNPVACRDSACDRVVDWLYPTLFATDPRTGVIVPASPDNTGLVLDPLLSVGRTQSFALRDDLTWSDGVPVTAYDVLFSAIAYEAAFSSGEGQPLPEIAALTLTGAHTLTVEFAEPDCAAPAQVNFQVVPAHVYAPDFAAKLDAFIASNPAPQSLDAWLVNRFVTSRNSFFDGTIAPVTAGEFAFESRRPFESVRLTSGESGFVFADPPDTATPVEDFLAGGSTYMINPPFNRRADLLAHTNLQRAVVPSERWFALTFNFADPNRPRNAYDVEGNLREQGSHPVMSDPAIRQAIRLAIDVDELIELGYQGYAQPLASMWPPTSWAFDPSRERVPFDFRAAEDLLQAAGWRDSDGDGVRECRECAGGNIGRELRLGLYSDSRASRVADLIARQLQRVGIGVGGSSDPASQSFDLYLAAYETLPTADPDISRRFSREADLIGAGDNSNYGSYFNQDVERLFTGARTVASCDIAARRALYGQIQDIFDADVVTIPLLVESDLMLVQPTVAGFDPLPGNLLWNIRDWVVTP